MVDSSGNALPIIVLEETSHSVWVNSEALKLAGIKDDVQDDVNRGMVYMRTADGSKLNGIVLENAGIAMLEHALNITVSSFNVNKSGAYYSQNYRLQLCSLQSYIFS